MFGIFDVIRLLMSALVVLPITTVLRESGYYLTATILGAKKKLIIGSGPILFQLPTLEIRRYFFMYSWIEYEELQPSNRFWHGLIYAPPIINPLIAGLLVNWLLAKDLLPDELIWNTFRFYIFYYILFDVLPVYLPDGQPTNGRAIFDLIRHGERSSQEEVVENQDNEPGYTEAQEETIENRDRDQQERGDHTNPDAQNGD